MGMVVMKTVSILLTRYVDAFGKFICLMRKKKFSHASISIDGNEEIFYSFNYKGLAIEKPKKYFPKLRSSEGLMMRFQVTLDVYNKIKSYIDEFLNKKGSLNYSQLGVILCILHIPYKFKNSYFCSQFITEILYKSGAVKLKKSTTLYLPSDIIDGLEFNFSPLEIENFNFGVA